MIRPPPRSPLFPYTPLFRSGLELGLVVVPVGLASGHAAEPLVGAGREEIGRDQAWNPRTHSIRMPPFFNDPATPEISPLSLHAALPIWPRARSRSGAGRTRVRSRGGATRRCRTR